MNELSLFTGAGGGLLATQHLLGFRTVCYVEIDPYCQRVLQSRIQDGLLDDAPIWDDVRTFDGKPWAGCVDLVTAGFPCTPFSCAGKRVGKRDKRNLWPDTLRVIDEVRPEWLLLENSPDIRCNRRQADHGAPPKAGYYGKILSDLASSGFDARWSVLSAAAVGACHGRRRLWVVAHAHSERCDPGREHDVLNGQSMLDARLADAADGDCTGKQQPRDLLGQSGRRTDNRAEEAADYHGEGLPQREGGLRATTECARLAGRPAGRGWWERWPAEPPLCGVDDGVANGLDKPRSV